jgi:hypothetical protein
MELYIEKEFLNNFYLEFDEDSPSYSKKILASILEIMLKSNVANRL